VELHLTLVRVWQDVAEGVPPGPAAAAMEAQPQQPPLQQQPPQLGAPPASHPQMPAQPQPQQWAQPPPQQWAPPMFSYPPMPAPAPAPAFPGAVDYMTALSSRVESLEGRLETSSERMLAMVEKHHAEMAAIREAENQRLKAQLAEERAAAERLRGEMLALATQNGELRLINDQLQKSGEGARAGGMNGRV